MRSIRLGLAATTLAFTTVVVLAAPAPAALPTPVFAEWSSGSTATLDGVAVTVDVSTSPYLDAFDVSGAAYDPPGSATQEMTNYNAPDVFTASLAEPMADVALYVKYLRGENANGPTSYTLGSTGGCTWSIQSGLGGATLTGNTLDVSGLGFLDGILLCTGTATTLTLSADGPASGFQAVTLAAFGGVAPTTTTTTTAPTAPTTTSTTAPAPAVAADTVAPAFTG